MNRSTTRVNSQTLSKALFSILVALSIFILVVPLSIPIEGGIIIIFLGSLWLGFQLWKHKSFAISKAFILVLLQVIYLLIFTQYSKPIPATYIQLQRVVQFSLIALLSYTTLRSEADRKPWEDALIIFAAALSVLSLFELVRWYSQYLLLSEYLNNLSVTKVAYRLSGSILGHPNPLAGFINFVWPIVLIRLIKTTKSYQRYLSGGLLFILFLVMFYTSSRGGWLGAIAGMVVIGMTLLVQRILRFEQTLSWLNIVQKYIKFVLAGGVTLLVLAFIILYRSTLTGNQALGFSSRSGIWIPVLEAIRESPVFGHGIGTFPIAYTAAKQLPPGFMAPSAHNLWLQIGVGYGLMGVLLLCIVMLIFTYQVLKTLRYQLPDEKLFPLAYVSGSAAFLVQQFFDYMLVTFSYTLGFVLIMVLLTRYSVSFRSWNLSRKNYTILGTAIISFLVVLQMIISSQVTYFQEFTSARNLALERNWEDLQDRICTTADEKKGNALYQFECSMAFAHSVSRQTHNGGVADQNTLNSAISYQQSSQNSNPYWAIQEANLAVLYWENEQRDQALFHMKNAVNAAPKSGILLVNLGWMTEQLGYEQDAVDYYTRALRLAPWMRGSLFTQKSALFQYAADQLDYWIDATPLWDEWYAAFNVHPGEFDHLKGLMALFGNQSDIAIQELNTSLQESPGSFWRNAYLALAYHRSGQSESAYGLTQIAYLIYKESENITESSLSIEIVGALMLENAEPDIAYELLATSFTKRQNLSLYDFYYTYTYGQRILTTDISPLLILSGEILEETYLYYAWLAEEAERRGDSHLAESVNSWLAELQGIAR